MLNYSCVLPILGSLLCASLGVFAFSRNPKEPVNIGFAAAMASISAAEAGSALLLLSRGPLLSALGLRLHVSGQALMTPGWLLFTASFAGGARSDSLRRWLPVSTMLGLVSVFFILQIGSPNFITLYGEPGGPGFGTLVKNPPVLDVGPRGRYFYSYLILTLVLNLVNIEGALRSARGKRKNEIRNVMYGAGGLLAFLVYVFSQALLLKSVTAQAFPLISAVTLISVAMMTLFVVRHRMLNVDIYVSRFIVYRSVTVLGAGVYLISVAVISYGIRFFSIPFDYFLASLFVFVSVLALFLFFEAGSMRRRIEQFVSRHFYRHKYEFKDKWMETIDRVGSKISAEDITVAVADIVSGTMAPRSLFIWLYDDREMAYTIRHGNVGKEYAKIAPEAAVIALMKDVPAPFPAAVEEGRRVPARPTPSPGDNIKPLLRETGAVICAPLDANGDLAGFMFIGPDISGAPYARDDVDFLRAVCSQAAVQIKNSTLSEKLAEAREAEVFYRMSSFVIHDLKNFTNSLSMVSENAARNMHTPAFQKDAMRAIDSTVARMRRLIGKLADPQASMGLKKRYAEIFDVIGNAVQKLGLSGMAGLRIRADGMSAPVNIDTEAIESVFMNLLSNAVEAAGKDGEISVRVQAGGGLLTVTIEDTGGGIPADFMRSKLWKPFKSTKKSGFGVGLFQCKTIIEAHGGSIKAESREGIGSTFTVTLPMDAKCVAC